VGGAPYGRQIDALTRGVDILVATPGRLVDLIERRSARLDLVEVAVLDEADYMADLGFLPVVTRLLEMTPDGGQRLLFSATLDRGVDSLVEKFLSNPVVHAVAPATAAVTSMTHRVFTVQRDDKVDVAAEVAMRPARTLFFVRTKHGADRLAKQLGRSGVDAAAIHGNLGQGARQRALAAFAEGSTRVLVATDVAARGIHVDDVDLVVHYDPPNDHKDYLHRSGPHRAGRRGRHGRRAGPAGPDARGGAAARGRQRRGQRRDRAPGAPRGARARCVRRAHRRAAPAGTHRRRPRPAQQQPWRPSRPVPADSRRRSPASGTRTVRPGARTGPRLTSHHLTAPTTKGATARSRPSS
jgi:superfamily II DNA/RNA helicase